MYRTPARKALVLSSDSSPEEPPRTTVAQARRSFEPQPTSPNSRPAEQAKQSTKAKVYKSRTTEAAALLSKIRMAINASRNTKTEIKNDVIESAMKMYQLVKEAEEKRTQKEETNQDQGQKIQQPKIDETKRAEDEEKARREHLEKDLKLKLEENLKEMKETKEMMGKMKEELSKHREEVVNNKTYASAVAGTPKGKVADATMALHSIAVTSKDAQETGEEVVEKFRRAVKAKEDGIKIYRLRKAKDQKVIIGFQDVEELRKVKENIKKNSKDLIVEDIKNKDPLIILKDVMSCHTDAEIVSAIKCQNKHIMGRVETDQDRMEIRYRRRTRNALTTHVVMGVSPQLWRLFTDAGAVFVDVQRVRVEDQSPLVQCSKCLGYGHGRRFCHAPLEACSHCGGPHKKAECADWLTAEKPACCNCQRAKLPKIEHSAMSMDCPVRRKWDMLARSSVAYC